MAKFPERVRELRLRDQLTIRDLAKVLSVDHTAVSKWENAINAAPQDMVIKLADYFGVSTDYLLGRTDDPRPFPVEDTRSIDERWGDPKNALLFTLYNEIKGMTTAQKEELLRFIDYLKVKKKRGLAGVE